MSLRAPHSKAASGVSLGAACPAGCAPGTTGSGAGPPSQQPEEALLLAVGTSTGGVELVDAASHALAASFAVHPADSPVRGLTWLGTSRVVSFSVSQVGAFLPPNRVTCRGSDSCACRLQRFLEPLCPGLGRAKSPCRVWPPEWCREWCREWRQSLAAPPPPRCLSSGPADESGQCCWWCWWRLCQPARRDLHRQRAEPALPCD